MNRELKFRFWSIKNKKFCYPHIWCQGNGVLVTNEEGDEIIIQQFTGFLDKNKKEIYEGDIIETIYNNNELGEVGFCNNTCGFRIKTIGKINIPMITLRVKEKDFVTGEEFKNGELIPTFINVVGNIFENADLLKQI